MFSVQRVLEPQDALQVQVIGRLVEEEHIRRLHQGGRDGQPLSPSPGEGRCRRVRALKSGAPQHDFPARLLLPFLQGQTGQRRRQDGTDRVIRLEQRILRDVSHPGLLAQRPHPGIRRFIPGQDFEQGGLAASIGPDQADPVSLVDAYERSSNRTRDPNDLDRPE